jgi:hypothetical protein
MKTVHEETYRIDDENFICEKQNEQNKCKELCSKTLCRLAPSWNPKQMKNPLSGDIYRLENHHVIRLIIHYFGYRETYEERGGSPHSTRKMKS